MPARLIRTIRDVIRMSKDGKICMVDGGVCYNIENEPVVCSALGTEWSTILGYHNILRNDGPLWSIAVNGNVVIAIRNAAYVQIYTMDLNLLNDLNDLRRHGKLVFYEHLRPAWNNFPHQLIYNGNDKLVVQYDHHIRIYQVWPLDYSVFALALALGDGDLAVARKLWDLLTPPICPVDASAPS